VNLFPVLFLLKIVDSDLKEENDMRNIEVVKDKTLANNIMGFLRDPYRFISKKLDSHNTDALETNLFFLKKAVILRGEEGARLFYNKEKFTRKKVMPGHVKNPLFGRGSIHGIDNEQHIHRKQMYLGLLNSNSISNFPEILENKWMERLARWQDSKEVVLLNEISEILCSAISEWTGFELPESNLSSFTKFNREMLESPGKFGPTHWYGRILRLRAEKDVGQYIQKIRKGEVEIDKSTAAYKIAFYKEDNKLLSLRQASIFLLNIIRPTVASARFVVFGALSLYENPRFKEKLKDEEFQEWYAHEVRRFYPFVPGLIAKARLNFTWKNYEFKKGTYALIDFYGTNRDPSTWNEPEKFYPERFKEWNGSAYNFIPQGGGEVDTNHRCPGEWLTIQVLKKTMFLLSQAMEYEVPPQDLTIEFNKLITQPKSGFIISKVKNIRTYM
jgi:fatty-acid peroxygenase